MAVQLKRLLITISLAYVPLALAGHESNGGDAHAIEFVNIAYRILDHLDRRQARLLNDSQTAAIAQAIFNTPVEMVPHRLRDNNGAFVMARVVPHWSDADRRRIQVDLVGWRDDLGGAQRIQLVFHEYLRVIGVDDDNYRVSRHLDVFAIPLSGNNRLELPVTGDWDGDGITNLAVVRGDTWHLDLDNQGDVAERNFRFGQAGDAFLSGDFNGDGKDTAVSYRDGRWSIDLDGLGNPAERTIYFGAEGDVAATGDYNGDGRDDLAVFRGGIWRINTQLDGSTNVIIRGFGKDGDIPLLADTNGDSFATPLLKRGKHFYLRDKDGGVKTISYGRSADMPLIGRFRRYDGSAPQSKDHLVLFRTGYWFVNFALHGESNALVYGFGWH